MRETSQIGRTMRSASATSADGSCSVRLTVGEYHRLNSFSCVISFRFLLCLVAPASRSATLILFQFCLCFHQWCVNWGGSRQTCERGIELS